jgi:hypothetical protein
MNRLLNFYNAHQTLIMFFIGAALGLMVGLLVGWVIWPVGVRNATPELLRQDYRDEYLVQVAREFALNHDVSQAQARLGTEYWRQGTPQEVLRDLAQRRGGEDGQRLEALAAALPEPAAASPARFRLVLLVVGVLLAAVGVAGLGYFALSRLLSRRRAPSERATTSRYVEPSAWAAEELPPVAQFVTTYSLGDDHYDPSFSIEKENGDFLGECGVGISETIGSGTPKKVTALEVWLFDKIDIRTVTRVVMSDYAFYDETMRARLATKGDLVQAAPGAEFMLETATLLMRARLLELEYAEGQGADSVFQRVTLELGVWVKPGSGEPSEPEMITTSFS